MWAALGTVLAPIFGLVKGWLAGRQKAQEAKQAIAAAKTQALIDHVNNLDQATAAWNLKAMDHSGWRADYMTIILSLPLIAIFIPPLVPYIKDGFAALTTLPKWYTGAVGIMVASAFGYQKFADWSMQRNAMKIVHGEIAVAHAEKKGAAPAPSAGTADVPTGDGGIGSPG